MADFVFSAFRKILSPLGIVMRSRSCYTREAIRDIDLPFPLIEMPSRLVDLSPDGTLRVPGVRSFFGVSMREAMRKAESALGPDALILNAKTTDPALRIEGEYEVVCAVYPPVKPRVAAEARPAAPQSDMAQELAELRSKVEELRRRLSVPGPEIGQDGHHHAASADPELSVHLRRLAEAGIPEARANCIVEAALQRAEKRRQLANTKPEFISSEGSASRVITKADLEEALIALLAAPYLALNQSLGQQVQVLVGARGSGKTTVALQLANELQAQRAGGVRILGLASRAEERGHLSQRTQETEVPCDILPDVHAISTRLQESDPTETVLIDAPPYDHSNRDEALELSRVLQSSKNVTVHLVLPTHLTTQELRPILEFFEMFAPQKLILSHFNEGRINADAIEAVLLSQKPVSFLCGGSVRSGSIQSATPKSLAHLFFNSIGSGLEVEYAVSEECLR